jgi:hypothetical protein
MDKYLETAKNIVEQGDCDGIYCKDCPSSFWSPDNKGLLCGDNSFFKNDRDDFDFLALSKEHIQAFKDYIKEKEGDKMEIIKIKDGIKFEDKKGDIYLVEESPNGQVYCKKLVTPNKKTKLKFKDIHDKWFKSKVSNKYFKLRIYDSGSKSRWKIGDSLLFTDDEVLEHFDIVDPEDVE